MRMIYTHHPHVSIPLKVSRYRRTPTMHADSAAFRLRHVRRPWELYAGIPNSGGNRVFKQRTFLVRQKAAVLAVLPTGALGTRPRLAGTSTPSPVPHHGRFPDVRERTENQLIKSQIRNRAFLFIGVYSSPPQVRF